jgi:hypothetical protein
MPRHTAQNGCGETPAGGRCAGAEACRSGVRRRCGAALADDELSAASSAGGAVLRGRRRRRARRAARRAWGARHVGTGARQVHHLPPASALHLCSSVFASPLPQQRPAAAAAWRPAASFGLKACGARATCCACLRADGVQHARCSARRPLWRWPRGCGDVPHVASGLRSPRQGLGVRGCRGHARRRARAWRGGRARMAEMRLRQRRRRICRRIKRSMKRKGDALRWMLRRRPLRLRCA